MSADTISVIFAFLCVFYVFASIISNIERSTKNKKIAFEPSNLLRSDKFWASQQITGIKKSEGIVVDEKNQQICILESDNLKPNRFFSYKDLLSVELIEDGETVTSTIRSSQIGGALIGGIALGGIGAVIGGLSGKTKSSEKVEKIILRVIVNDTKNPLHEVYFLNSEEGISKKSSQYPAAMKKARHWHSLIEVLIKRADMEDKENAVNNVIHVSQNSIADEIKKLAELRDAGILGDVEFQQQKEKLLESN